MEVLDTTVVNVSLPHIAGSLSASNDEATWTLTSYLVANAIILAHDRLAGRALRAETPAAVFGERIHHRVVLLRPGAQPALPHRLPRDSGRMRRRPAAACRKPS